MEERSPAKVNRVLPLILVIDDDQAIGENMQALMGEDFEVVFTTDFSLGFERVLDLCPAVVLLDYYDDENEPRGLELLRRITALAQAPLVVMLTRETSLETIIGCMRKGAFDYLTKPLNPRRGRQVLNQAFTQVDLKQRLAELEKERDEGKGKLVWASRAMEKVLERVNRVAPTEATVLISGETGTGKDLIAAEIHRRSHRRSGRFLKVNCAAMPPSLLESELFGHERGAFTGAISRRRGVFEMAAGGTLFLNEVGDCPVQLQAKLLDVMEDRRFRRLGGDHEVQADVRIIAATHRDMPQLIEEGRLREDLFHRFNQYRIHIPPLRERPEDVAAITEHFVATYAARMRKDISGITPAALKALTSREWRGNVRVLRSVIENAIIHCDGPQIDIDDTVEDPLVIGQSIQPYREAREVLFRRFKWTYFSACLKACEGNVAKVAKLSQRPAQAVWNTLREIELDPAGFKPPRAGTSEGG